MRGGLDRIGSGICGMGGEIPFRIGPAEPLGGLAGKGFGGGSIADRVLVSPVSRRLFIASNGSSSVRSRFMPFSAGGGMVFRSCWRREMCFAKTAGSSVYICWIRSMDIKSTGAGGSIDGRDRML